MFNLTRGAFVASGLSLGATVPVVAADAPTLVASPPLTPEERAKLETVTRPVPFSFDRARFFAIAQQPYPHRQLFVARSYFNALSVAGIQNSLDAYADPNGFASGPRSLHLAYVVIGGHAVMAR